MRKRACDSNINVYCGWFRNTVIAARPKIIGDIAFEIPCLECDGSGEWDFCPDEPTEKCVCCKGTGKQYIGI